MTHATSPKGLALIEKYEGFRARPLQMPDGRWIVGFGHVRRDEPGPDLTRETARDLLIADLAPIESAINEAVTTPLTPSQFDVLVSFAYSIGLGAFLNSQVLRRLNAGQLIAAACALEAWRKTDAEGEEQISEALVCRRATEKAMFLKDIANAAAPSPVLQPRLDHAAAILGAPADYVAAPALVQDAPHPEPEPKPESGPAAAPATPGERLTEILSAEPATAELLLTQVVQDEPDDAEIATAHAKPAPREIFAKTAPSLPRAQSRSDQLGPMLLLLFGFALLLLGASQWLTQPPGAFEIVAGLLMASAGAWAGFMAVSGMRRAPKREHARAI
jgi:lysozyme